MGKGLTIRQEKFAQKYVECGNASEAYRYAYPSSTKWKDKTVWEKASRLSADDKVKARVNELKEASRQASQITREEILRICADVIRGAAIVDNEQTRKEEVAGGITKTTTTQSNISKEWAIDRVCKMCGFDSPTEVLMKQEKQPYEDWSEEELEEELRRLRKGQDV